MIAVINNIVLPVNIHLKKLLILLIDMVYHYVFIFRL